jgi:anion-transporting  ArsA/GET3 family ATPase
MSPAGTTGFFAACNVLIVAGKGGVGKTTVGASLGIAAARAGSDVLLIELEGHSTLGPLLGGVELGYDDVEIELSPPAPGRLRARRIQPDNALTDYLDRAGLGPISNRLTKTGAMDVVVTAAPGIRDLLTLGKIRQLEQAGDADLIIVDAPAAGHALTFLTAAAGLAGSTSSGPIREQADLVLEMFADDSRCQVVLVTLPEETPVTETIETAFSLEDEVGLKLAPVVVNGLWPEIDGLADEVAAAAAASKPGVEAALEAAAYRLARIEDQLAEVERLADELPLDQIHLPFLFRTELTPAEVERLAQALSDGLAGLAGLSGLEATAEGAGSRC